MNIERVVRRISDGQELFDVYSDGPFMCVPAPIGDEPGNYEYRLVMAWQDAGGIIEGATDPAENT